MRLLTPPPRRPPWRRSLTALAAVAVLAAGTACSSGIAGNGGSQKKKGPILLGMVVPMSGSSSAIGPYMKGGATLALQEINAKGGVNGRKLKLDVQDGACDAKTAVAAANKLASAGVVGSVGGYCSSATLPTLSVFHKANIPMVIPAANSMDLVNQYLNNVFLINGTGIQQSEAAMKWITHEGAKHVAVMNDTTSYSKDIADRTAKHLKASGGADLAINEAVNPGESDYSANVNAVLRKHPDFVYWTGYYQEGGLIIRQLRQAGYHGTIMVADGSVDQQLVKIAGADSAEGVYATMTQTPQTIPGAKDWSARYKKAIGSDPGPYSPQSYDAVRVMAHAIDTANSTNSKKIISALENMNNLKLFSGPLKFQKNHTLTSGGFLILVVKNGKFTLESRLK